MSIIAMIPLSIFGAYVGLFLEEIGTINIIIGFVLAMRNIFQIFLRVPMGNFSQIIGRRPLLLNGVFCYSFSLFILFFSSHWIFVLIAVFFLALGMASYWPVLFSYIGDIEKENIGNVQGRVFQANDIGTIIGSIFAYLLLEKSGVGLEHLFGWGALIGFVGVITLFYLLPETLPKEQRYQVDSKILALLNSFVSMLRTVYKTSKNKSLGLIYLFQLVISFLEYFVSSFFPFLIVFKGYSKGVVAQIVWITAASLLFFKPYFGGLIDKFGVKKPLSISLILSASAVFLLITVDSLLFLILIYMLYSATILTCYLGVNTGTTLASSQKDRGMALGTLGFYVSLGRSVSTISLSPLWGPLGLEMLFVLTALFVILTSVLLLFLSRNVTIDSMKEIQSIMRQESDNNS